MFSLYQENIFLTSENLLESIAIGNFKFGWDECHVLCFAHDQLGEEGGKLVNYTTIGLYDV